MGKQNITGRWVSLSVLLVTLFSITGQAVAEANAVACHVLLENGAHDIYIVATKDISIAKKVGETAQFNVDGGGTVSASKVVECIPYPKGRFSDEEMRKYLKDRPM